MFGILIKYIKYLQQILFTDFTRNKYFLSEKTTIDKLFMDRSERKLSQKEGLH